MALGYVTIPRRTGRTTRLCTEVAYWLATHPTGTAVIVGPHVHSADDVYRAILVNLNVDMSRVRLATPSNLGVVRGLVGKVFDDDHQDMTEADIWCVIDAAEMIRPVP